MSQLQAPFQPMPRSPKRRRRRWFVLGALALIVLVIAIAASSHGSSSPHVTRTPTAHPTSQATSLSTQAATTVPTSGVATHGIPRIGGPLSDFYGKYGRPMTQGVGGSQTWIVDQQQQTLVNATANAHGIVTAVTLTSAANWSVVQTKQQCAVFLPADASQFNVAGPYTDYHSRVGEIVMQLTPASCVLVIAPS